MTFWFPISIRIDSLWALLLLDFSTDHLETCILVLHGLKICVWFWGYPIFFFFNSHFFDLDFPGPISTIRTRIDNLWAPIFIEFSTDHFKTMHTCFTWSVGVHVVLGSFSYYFCHFFFFFFFFFFVTFFFVTFFTYVSQACCLDPPWVFTPIRLNLCIIVLRGLKMCVSLLSFLSTFFPLFQRSFFLGVIGISINTLWAQHLLSYPLIILKLHILVVWRCACGLKIILPWFLLPFSSFYFSFFFPTYFLGLTWWSG